MNNISPEIVSFIVGVLVTNFSLIIGAYVSLKVSNARLETLVGKLEKDVDNLGSMYRQEFINQQERKLG